MLVKLLKNERCNNSEACNKWDLLIQTVRHEKSGLVQWQILKNILT